METPESGVVYLVIRQQGMNCTVPAVFDTHAKAREFVRVKQAAEPFVSFTIIDKIVG